MVAVWIHDVSKLFCFYTFDPFRDQFLHRYSNNLGDNQESYNVPSEQWSDSINKYEPFYLRLWRVRFEIGIYQHGDLASVFEIGIPMLE